MWKKKVKIFFKPLRLSPWLGSTNLVSSAAFVYIGHFNWPPWLALCFSFTLRLNKISRAVLTTFCLSCSFHSTLIRYTFVNAFASFSSYPTWNQKDIKIWLDPLLFVLWILQLSRQTVAVSTEDVMSFHSETSSKWMPRPRLKISEFIFSFLYFKINFPALWRQNWGYWISLDVETKLALSP